MSSDAQGRNQGDRSTRDALMDAALAQLEARGVLAGLNLREVADEVGITPANIYYYFGSRQGLLRAALARETELLAGPVEHAAELDLVGRRLHMFDAIGANPTLALTALLALDRDPDYQPLPFLDETRRYHAALVEAGDLPPELDVDAVHLLGVAVSIGVAIYAEAAARQLGTSVDELRARTKAVFEEMLVGLVQPLPHPDDTRSRT
ncbi:MAG: TetR/AcrR family transcriptional regulator [Acidimicrobiales bacterium]